MARSVDVEKVDILFSDEGKKVGGESYLTLRRFPKKSAHLLELLLRSGLDFEVLYQDGWDEEALLAFLEWDFFTLIGDEVLAFYQLTQEIHELSKNPHTKISVLEKKCIRISSAFLRFEKKLKSIKSGKINHARHIFNEVQKMEKAEGVSILPQAFIVCEDKDLPTFLAYLLSWPADLFSDVIKNLRVFFHDLRNPMAAVKTYPYLIKKGPQNKDKYMAALERVSGVVADGFLRYVTIFESVKASGETPQSTNLQEHIEKVLLPTVADRKMGNIKMHYIPLTTDHVQSFIPPGIYELLLQIFVGDFTKANDLPIMTDLKEPITIFFGAEQGDIAQNEAVLHFNFMVCPNPSRQSEEQAEELSKANGIKYFFEKYFSTPFRKYLLTKAGIECEIAVEPMATHHSESKLFKVDVKWFFKKTTNTEPMTTANA
jgi:hypothetical protein